MNAEELYSDFKDCLDFLGVRWSNKDEVKVWLDGQFLVLEHQGRQARLKLETPG